MAVSLRWLIFVRIILWAVYKFSIPSFQLHTRSKLRFFRWHVIHLCPDILNQITQESRVLRFPPADVTEFFVPMVDVQGLVILGMTFSRVSNLSRSKSTRLPLKELRFVPWGKNSEDSEKKALMLMPKYSFAVLSIFSFTMFASSGSTNSTKALMVSSSSLFCSIN